MKLFMSIVIINGFKFLKIHCHNQTADYMHLKTTVTYNPKSIKNPTNRHLQLSLKSYLPVNMQLETYNDSEISVFNESESDADESEEPEYETYTIRPPINAKFNVDKVKDLLKLVVYEELEDKRYHSFKPEEMSKHLCELIQQKLTEFPYEGYKYVVEVLLAENKGQGMEFQSKCLWDADTDNVATEFINTEYVICVATVFGIYYY